MSHTAPTTPMVMATHVDLRCKQGLLLFLSFAFESSLFSFVVSTGEPMRCSSSEAFISRGVFSSEGCDDGSTAAEDAAAAAALEPLAMSSFVVPCPSLSPSDRLAPREVTPTPRKRKERDAKGVSLCGEQLPEERAFQKKAKKVAKKAVQRSAGGRPIG